MVPLHLQQWLLDHTSCGESKFFQHKEKIIFFTKDIVDKVFGFPLSTKPFVMESSDPDIIIEVEQLLAQYKQGRKTIPVKVLVSILLGANSEEDKLMEDPNAFDKIYVVAEFQKILNSDFEIATMDILHFPTVVSNQWVLMCVNPLFDTINFFDPTCTISKETQNDLVMNLLFNLNTTCKELHLFGKDIGKFKKSKPTNYPSNAPLPDGGIYIMLYSDNWTGKFMRDFSKEIVAKYRMLKSYDILYCIQNKVPPESFERRRKRRCFGKKKVDWAPVPAAVTAEEGAKPAAALVAGGECH